MRYITTPGFLIGLSVVLLVIGVGAPFVIADITSTPAVPGKPKDWILLTVVAGGVAGFLFNSAVKFHSELRDGAFKLLLSSAGASEFRKQVKIAMRFFRSAEARTLTSEQIQKILAARPVDAGQSKESSTAQTPLNNPTRAGEIKEAILTAANFFEEMAIAIYERETHEGILRHFYISILMQFYDGFKPFIPVIRNIGEEYKFEGFDYLVREKPSAYSKLNWLHSRWKSVWEKELRDAPAIKFAETYGFVSEAEIMPSPKSR